MSTSASALAQSLAQHTTEDVIQALSLLDSIRPELRQGLRSLCEDATLRRYSGMVISFNYEKGFGFIQSQDATAEFGKDVFCSANEIGEFKVGDHVTFTLIANKNNKPQARLLQGLDGGGRHRSAQHPAPGEPPMKVARYVAPQAAPPPPPVAVPPPPPAARAAVNSPVSADPSARFVGVVQSFSPEKHFGFIANEELMAMYGKDVFVSDMEIQGFGVGDQVSFNIALNGKGQPQARALQTAVPISGPPSFGEEDGRRYAGSIRAFFPDRHFGFIECTETHAKYNKDVFLSENEIGQFAINERVSFRVALNKQGQPQARDLAPA